MNVRAHPRDLRARYHDWRRHDGRGAPPAPSGAVAGLNALWKGRLSGGERVAIFGLGGLGMAAVQLAHALGAIQVFAVDLDHRKLAAAGELGAVAVDAKQCDAVTFSRDATHGAGVDVALELIGLPLTVGQALRSVGVHGRAVVAGLTTEPVSVDCYRDLLGREAELIGASDHLLTELPLLLELACRRKLDLSRVVKRPSHSMPLP